ncbi:hypothetical protein FG87_21910 [Nocardia vulneris]|uniref:Uncharacterized protein n=2 Tax=Nocardia vulneris TaxID=1141657 RepID=A0ABR4ZCD9_9NOCA|nr:hypothetical protein FG87_21910 [Nocardia vulneris]
MAPAERIRAVHIETLATGLALYGDLTVDAATGTVTLPSGLAPLSPRHKALAVILTDAIEQAGLLPDHSQRVTGFIRGRPAELERYLTAWQEVTDGKTV